MTAAACLITNISVFRDTVHHYPYPPEPAACLESISRSVASAGMRSCASRRQLHRQPPARSARASTSAHVAPGPAPVRIYMRARAHRRTIPMPVPLGSRWAKGAPAVLSRAAGRLVRACAPGGLGRLRAPSPAQTLQGLRLPVTRRQTLQGSARLPARATSACGPRALPQYPALTLKPVQNLSRPGRRRQPCGYTRARSI